MVDMWSLYEGNWFNLINKLHLQSDLYSEVVFNTGLTIIYYNDNI